MSLLNIGKFLVKVSNKLSDLVKGDKFSAEFIKEIDLKVFVDNS